MLSCFFSTFVTLSLFSPVWSLDQFSIRCSFFSFFIYGRQRWCEHVVSELGGVADIHVQPFVFAMLESSDLCWVPFCYLKSVLLFTFVIHPEVIHVIPTSKQFFSSVLNQSILILVKSDLLALGIFSGDFLDLHGHVKSTRLLSVN